MTYSIKSKKKQKDRIHNLSKKEKVRIYEILKSNNVVLNKNSNGFFCFYHNLNDNVYTEVKKYLKNVDKEYQDTIGCSDLSETQSEYVPYNTEEYSINKDIDSKFRLTTREKNFMKMVEYNKNIDIENNINEDVEYREFDMSDTNLNISLKNKN